MCQSGAVMNPMVPGEMECNQVHAADGKSQHEEPWSAGESPSNPNFGNGHVAPSDAAPPALIEDVFGTRAAEPQDCPHDGPDPSAHNRGEGVDQAVDAPPFDDVDSNRAMVEAQIVAVEALPNSTCRIASDVERLRKQMLEIKAQHCLD
ncbi:hypothetical protein Nepgr_014658 [Nepenthes gracilis]|uniref:Uncharacterized protein n=1 Tax=Nepenthes gracilis TaxID=150966 RepID=A0AAD3SKF2_NEPGR|nr:hypothetical protein Nepgr_014658 [Nepenthes gracilis]